MEPQHIFSIDEHHSRKVVIIEDRPAITREERFKHLMEAGAQTREVKVAKIQKVIFLLRGHKCFVNFFEPRVASLGPIHHGNPKYKLGEGYKLILAYEFVQGSGKSINHLYDEAVMEIKQLRGCFEEEVTMKYDDEALAWMLFVDGCAILEYILCATNEKYFKELNIKNDSVAFAHQDLFLLENQVPYRLLTLLMGLSKKNDELRNSIEIFIQNVTSQQTEPQQKQRESSHDSQRTQTEQEVPIEIFIPNDTSQQTEPQQKQGESSQTEREVPIEREPTHLLDLLRTTLLKWDPSRSSKPDTPSEKATRASEKQKAEERIVTIEDLDPPLSSKSDPHYGKTRRIWPCRKKPRKDRDWQSYRNVQELKSSGIRLKRSKSSCLRDISFSRRFGFYPGYLSLPPITLDDSSGPKFMNLIAYEMCLDFENDFGITSFISFLDSLIDEANDVKDLRKARILHNFLGSDKEVADLFNEIGTDLVPNAKAYKDVKCQIQEYYDNNCMTWMTQFFHDRFSAPWTMLAFLGVLLGLVLTAAQTWLAAFPNPGKKSS